MKIINHVFKRNIWLNNKFTWFNSPHLIFNTKLPKIKLQAHGEACLSKVQSYQTSSVRIPSLIFFPSYFVVPQLIEFISIIKIVFDFQIRIFLLQFISLQIEPLARLFCAALFKSRFPSSFGCSGCEKGGTRAPITGSSRLGSSHFRCARVHEQMGLSLGLPRTPITYIFNGLRLHSPRVPLLRLLIVR